MEVKFLKFNFKKKDMSIKSKVRGIKEFCKDFWKALGPDYQEEEIIDNPELLASEDRLNGIEAKYFGNATSNKAGKGGKNNLSIERGKLETSNFKGGKYARMNVAKAEVNNSKAIAEAERKNAEMKSHESKESVKEL